MPDSILEQLRTLGEQIRTAEAEHVERVELLPLWRARRELVKAAAADERRPTDIAKALDISRERVRQLIDA